MTVSSTERTAGPFTRNGSQVDYPFTMRVFADTDILATQTTAAGIVSTLTLGSDYTVAVNADQRTSPGGTLTMLDAGGVAGETLDFTTSLEATQGARLTNAGGFYPEVVENALDKLTILLQQIGVFGDQSLRAPFPEVLDELPSAPDRANTQLLFDSNGQPYLGAPVSGTAADVLLRLADSSDATEGPALVGFNPALAYTDPESLGYQLPWATFRGTGGDDTAALQALLTAGYNVQLVGTIYANNLTASTSGQHIKGVGRARVIKNASGALITFSAADQCTEGVEWRGDASTPTYTGANVVSTAVNFQWLRSGSMWAHGAALVLQGGNPLVLGQCQIIQSALIGSSYDIDCGLDGTARLYGRIIGVYTSQNTGGIRFTDTGTWCVSASQFADLKIQSGGSGYLAGCSGGSYSANRITGNVSVGISSALFSANAMGGAAIVFEAGTSGHSFDDSNACSGGTTITDNSNASNVIDLRLIAPDSYTPTITGTGVVIGDAVCTGQVTKRGRLCTATFRIVMGATTNFGSGAWSVSLPYIPATTLSYWGQVRALDSGALYYLGTINTSTSGVAEALMTGDGAAGQFNSSRPFTWVAGDVLEGSVTYVTAT